MTNSWRKSLGVKIYMIQKFCVKTTILYWPDSFGHPGQKTSSEWWYWLIPSISIWPTERDLLRESYVTEFVCPLILVHGLFSLVYWTGTRGHTNLVTYVLRSSSQEHWLWDTAWKRNVFLLFSTVLRIFQLLYLWNHWSDSGGISAKCTSP